MELRRNEKITFRCTELEKDALAEQAARCSLSVSEYCRSLSLGGRPRERYTEEERQLLRDIAQLKGIRTCVSPHFGSLVPTLWEFKSKLVPTLWEFYPSFFVLMWGLCIFAANQSFMKKKLPITKNKDVVVSWVYTWSKQQDMSIHEQRIVLRILEACQAELKGVKLKDYAGTKRKFEHGLWDVDAQMHVSDVIFSGRDYNEIIAALDSLAGRFFTYEDDEEWWKCGFISNPKYKKRTGIITFRVSNDLWDVFTKFAKGYREFELNKALALPTGYSLRFYMLMSGQVYPLDISLENLKDRLGIPADKYKDKNGKDRIDHFEERVLKPAKAALDESCPYTFNYVKVRENPNNKRSKVTGFRFYPVYQPQFRDEELEGKELQAKVTARYQIDSHVYEYLRYSCGFTSEEINRNKETFITAQEKITDLIGELALLNGKSREKNNPKGWIINALKGKIKDK
jgi:hypothetical protein